MTTNNAFPYVEKNDDGTFYMDRPGMTKREYFAAKAMQGLLASCADKVSHPYTLSPDAVQCADALIAELNKTEEA